MKKTATQNKPATANSKKIVDPSTELEKAKKKIDKLTRERNDYKKWWFSMIDQRDKYKEESKQWQAMYCQALIDITEERTKQLEKEQEQYQKQRDKYLQKLSFHELYDKGVIETPCTSCRLNGNCRIQDIYQGEVIKECVSRGPFPFEEGEEVRKIVELKIDLVDQWNNEDLLN